MNVFSELEKKSILQCFWQLLSAKPSQKEIAFIDKLIANWNLTEDNGEWVVIAIQQNPFESFDVVAQMSEEKRKEFKKMVVKIVECEGNNYLKTRVAATLFEKTNIPYAIKARNLLYGEDIGKGMYEIL